MDQRIVYAISSRLINTLHYIFQNLSSCPKLGANTQPIRFLCRLSPDTHYFTHVLELNYDITAACFTNDTDQILIGTRDGEIIVIT